MLVYNVCTSKQWNKTTSNPNLNYKKSQNDVLTSKACGRVKVKSGSCKNLSSVGTFKVYVKNPLQPGQEIPQVTKIYFKALEMFKLLNIRILFK